MFYITCRNSTLVRYDPAGGGFLQIDLGTAPTWDIGKQYAQGDRVLFANQIYIAIVSNTAQQPDISPTKWLGTAAGPAWSNAVTYNKGDSAKVSGRLYVSLNNNNTGNPPASTPAKWFDVNNYVGSEYHFPYTCRYDPIADLVYVGGLKSNAVVIVDPNTNLIKATKTGFDSPFDVVFTKDQDPAFPDDPTKQISTAFAVQQGDVPLKKIAKP